MILMNACETLFAETKQTKFGEIARGHFVGPLAARLTCLFDICLFIQIQHVRRDPSWNRIWMSLYIFLGSDVAVCVTYRRHTQTHTIAIVLAAQKKKR